MDIVKAIWYSVVQDAKDAFFAVTDNPSSLYIIIALASLLGMLLPTFVLAAVFVGAVLALAYLKYTDHIESIEGE